MTTHLISKVYLIWISSKGGKWLKEIYFNEEKAEQRWYELNTLAQQQEHKQKFRIEEKATSDYIIYTD